MLTVSTPRAWSNRELRKIIPFLPPSKRIINVSGWKDSDKENNTYQSYFPHPATYAVSNYSVDEARGSGGDTGALAIDLQSPLCPTLQGAFDVALSHTVLEHVQDPMFAFEQIAKLSSDIVITIVPFKQKLHFEPGQYGDYYRFTPFSLRRMHERAGLTLLYESFTPPPALDVYMFCVGTKRPLDHAQFPKHVPPIEELNYKIGSFTARDLLINVLSRAIKKLSRT